MPEVVKPDVLKPDLPQPCDVVVLLSGTGGNLQAMIDSFQDSSSPARIRAVISNRADAYGLERANNAGIETRVLDHTAYEGRDAFDTALIELIDSFAPKLVVLAGFMRILTPDFVRHYHGRLLNIHPSLLPLYKGLHTHQRVLEAGDHLIYPHAIRWFAEGRLVLSEQGASLNGQPLGPSGHLIPAI